MGAHPEKGDCTHEFDLYFAIFTVILATFRQNTGGMPPAPPEYAFWLSFMPGPLMNFKCQSDLYLSEMLKN